MGKVTDPGFCLLGTRLLLDQVNELTSSAEAAMVMDPEGVHKMRVASRRLRAGLPIFSSCLKVDQNDRWRKEIKGLTGALGEARDTDVQIEFLREFLDRSQDNEKAGVAALLDMKVVQRREQQGQVKGWLDNLAEEGLLTEMRQCLNRNMERLQALNPDPRSRASYSTGMAFVTSRFNGLIKLEKAVEDPLDKEGHHRMRIAAKQLRYTLEAFRPLFDDQLTEEISALKEIQDLLGEMHDCDVWETTIDNLFGSTHLGIALDEGSRPGLAAIRSDRARRRGELYAKFSTIWHRRREERFFERLPELFQTAMTVTRRDALLPDPGRPSRLAIVSDIHGNMDALRAVLADADVRGAQAFLNLGDLVGMGPYPDEVVTTIRQARWLSISGNYDLKVLEFSRASRRPKARSVKGAVVAATVRDLSQSNLDYLASLPPEVRLEVMGKRVLMVHASPADPEEHLGPDTPDHRLAELGQIADADVVMVGHSHTPFVKEVDGVLFINPGSVGRPVDGDPRASYAILDTTNMTVELHRVPYEVVLTVAAMRAKGLPEGVVMAVLTGGSSGDQMKVRKVSAGHVEDMERLETFARKMNVDHPHAEQVLRVATLLFRELKPLHGLGGRDRFLLEAGCLLHDVGACEGMKGHNRTSYRIIMESKLPLSDQDRNMVACLARYHRKRMPRESDPEIASLSEGERKRLYRIASLLRVADGLDYHHDAVIKDLTCEIGKEEVVVKVTSSTDWDDERSAALQKADLFERTFNKRLRLV